MLRGQLFERNELEWLIFKSIGHRLSMDLMAIKNLFNDWELIPIIVNEKLVAVVMRNGNELHSACPEENKGKWVSRKGIKNVIVKTVKEFGSAKTSVFSNNFMAVNFVNRLGFKEKYRTEDVIYFELTESNHA